MVEILKAQELRIGNWYLGNGYHPEQITAKDILELSDDPLDDYYEPIPLTEEWLLKFGFEKEDFDYWHHEKSKLIIGHTTNNDVFQYEYLTGYLSQTEMLDLLYVHQLQNLYFALTVEELEMK